MEINNSCKTVLWDLLMSTNPYEQSSKEVVKEALEKAKQEEGYPYLTLSEYLDVKTMLNEMEL